MRLRELRFGAPLIYFGVVAAGAWAGGFAGWASFVFGGTLYPLIDALPFAPVGGAGASESRRATRVLVGYAILQTALVGWVLYLVTSRSYAVWELIGIALSLGTLTGGIGIPAAHELIHARSKAVRGVGLYLLAMVLYMHFRIEHIYGHHLNVATPEDPATARRGEGLWRFIARSVPLQFVSAYRIEERLRRSSTGLAKRPNRLLLYQFIQASLLLLVLWSSGWTGIAVMLGQAVIAITFLEATNYIEHYGLERRRIGPGYEPVSPRHSWNTTSFFTNSLAFNLGLHADHHANPQRAFTDLRHFDHAPQLPAGYLTMLSLAAVPPLWRRIMDLRLDAYRAEHRAGRAPFHPQSSIEERKTSHVPHA